MSPDIREHSVDDAARRPSPRLPGYDVARALALLGMVLVNFRGKLEAQGGVAAFVWLAERVEGKPAALFVLLAGVGLSLSARHCDELLELRVLRVGQVERAAILVGVGVLLAHVWDADILHFHGVYLLLALPLLRARTATLWLCTLVVLWSTMMLQHELDWAVQPSAATLGGAVRHLLFSGLYPVFPWLAFVLVGIIIGRLELGDRRVRFRTLAVALAIVLVSTVLDELARWDRQSGALGLGARAGWLTSWPRAPRPMFVVQGSALAVAVICGCISLVERIGERRPIIALVATGQLAFTLYVGHVVAVLLPLQHGLLRGLPLELAYAYALAFYAAAIAFALWWRRRWPLGPLEGLMRQVTRRSRDHGGELRLR